MHTGGRKGNWDEHLNGLWYLLLNGCAWRALPGEFGPWFTIYQFFNRLSHDGFFDFLEVEMVNGDKAEAAFYESTHIKVHQHSNGRGSPEDQAIGKSRGGANTKIHAAVDILGRLASCLVITPGNVSDHTVAPQLTRELKDTAAVGDKGYDSKAHRDQLRRLGCEPCIPSRSNVKIPEHYDKELYKSRHVIENKFQRIKVFRRVAARFEKTKRMFHAMLITSISATYEKDGLWGPM